MLPVTSDRKRELLIFERQARLKFKKIDLLNSAFAHRSYVNEKVGELDNNEKLEFLGDSVLGLIVSDYLFRTLPERSEGDLAKIKSFVVSEESLAKIARKLNVDHYVLIGKGEENSGGRKKKAILADCMEAIIGACFLDSGFKTVQNFVLSILVPEIETVLQNKHRKDYKTLLQEYVQKRFKCYPKYQLVKKSGPDHDRVFWIEVKINNENYGSGKGKNKKQAEQEAARIAYGKLMENEL